MSTHTRTQTRIKRTKSFVQIKIPPAIIGPCAVQIIIKCIPIYNGNRDILFFIHALYVIFLRAYKPPFFLKSIGFFELSGHPYNNNKSIHIILYYIIYVITKQTFDLYGYFFFFKNASYFLRVFITRP